MYLGRYAKQAPTDAVSDAPSSSLLLRLSCRWLHNFFERFQAIAWGNPKPSQKPPEGLPRFPTRCPKAQNDCRLKDSTVESLSPQRAVAVSASLALKIAVHLQITQRSSLPWPVVQLQEPEMFDFFSASPPSTLASSAMIATSRTRYQLGLGHEI